jgi:hypothetical protein
VQFHPESASTQYGYAMLDRFLHGARSRPDTLPPLADGAPEPPARTQAGGDAEPKSVGRSR